MPTVQGYRSTDPKLKVLHAYKVCPPDNDGGISEAIFRIVFKAPSDVSSLVLVCRTFGFGSLLMVNGIEVERTSSFGQISSLPISPSYIFRLRKRMKEFDTLVLHAPFPLGDLSVRMGGLRNDQGLVVHWHAEIVGRNLVRPIFEPLIRRTLERADKIIVASESMIEHSDQLRPYAAKCVVAPYGIDTNWWIELPQEEIAYVEKLRKDHRRLIVACGRLVGYKGFEILLEAVRRVDGKLVIIGTGPLEQKLRAQSVDLGIDDRVTFTGFLDRKEQRRWFTAADVFVLPSVTIAEAFGIAQLEAMCCGTAVINTNLPTGVPFVARHGLEAITVPPSDVAALAGAIRTVLDDRSLADRLGRAGQTRARENYSWVSFSERSNAIYAESFATRRAHVLP